MATVTEILTQQLNRRLNIKSVVDELCGKDEKGKSRITIDKDGNGTMPNPFPYDEHSGYTEEEWSKLTCYILQRKNTAICYETGLGGLPCRFARDLQMLSADMAIDALMPISGIDAEERKQLCAEAKNESSMEVQAKQNRQDAMERMHSLFMREFWRKGSKGQDFAFVHRGWTVEMARDFELGYHDAGTIVKAAEQYGMSKMMLETYGYLSSMEHQSSNTGSEIDFKDFEDNLEYFERFQFRISYPIRNAEGRLTAFSFRDTGVNEERWKKSHPAEVSQGKKYAQKCLYMNSECTIEPNEMQLFGIDLAAKEITNTNRSLYIVEGQPDVMRLRSIGVRNVVGIMTSRMSDAKLSILTDLGYNTLIFVPDIDRFEADKEPYGAGFAACMENVEKANRIGITKNNEASNLTLKVVELISDASGISKADADSFLRSAKIDESKPVADPNNLTKVQPSEVWSNLQPHDGIAWWAAQASKAIGMGGAEEKVTWQKRLAVMLADIRNKDVREIIATDAIKAGKNFTKSTVAAYMKEVLGKRKQQAVKKEQTFKGDLSLYGFHEMRAENGNGHVYVINEKEEPFTDFVIEPHYYIKNLLQGSIWICEFICENGNKEVIPLTDEDVTAVAKFKRTAARASMCFIGKDPELANLFCFVKSNCQRVQMITRMGWQPSLGVWCWGNGVYENGEFVECNKFGVATISKGRYVYIPAAREVGEMDEDSDQYQFEHDFSFENDTKGGFNRVERPKLADVLANAFYLWGDNGCILVMWLVGAIFRDVVVQYGEHYPILAGYGPKGSGKSASSEFLCSFYTKTDSLRKTLAASKPALDSMVLASSNALVHWDEYSDAIGRDADKLDMIKGFWDGSTRAKMNAQTNFKSAISTRVKSALILTGQVMPNHDASMLRRFCLCEYYDNKELFNDPTNKAAFELMTSWKKIGLKHLTHELLNYRKDIEQNYKRFYDETREDVYAALRIYSNIVPSIADNFINLLSVMKTLSREAWWPFSFEHARQLCIRRIVWQSGMSEAKDERAAFWNTLQRAVNRFEVIKNVHYKVKPSSAISKQEKDAIRNDINTGCRRVLLLRYDDVYPILRSYAKNDDDLMRKLMDSATMFHYVEKQGCFGKLVKETFFNVDNNNRPLRDKDGITVPAKRQPCFAFNYDKLTELYPDLHLEDAPSFNEIDGDKQETTGEDQETTDGAAGEPQQEQPTQFNIQTPDGNPF